MVHETKSEEQVSNRGGTPAACAACRMPIGSSYYDVNGQVYCERCRHEFENPMRTDGGTRPFLKAALFGALAALAGGALYFAVVWVTGYEFGLVAIVVGLMVGHAVRYASAARGGWAYQLLAVLLTYCSITSTYVPLLVGSIATTAEQTESAVGEAGSGVAGSSEEARLEPAGGNLVEGTEAPGLASIAVGLGIIFLVALAAPFLAGFENLVGILIIGIGLYEAWKLNRRVPLAITGPHPVGNLKAVAE